MSEIDQIKDAVPIEDVVGRYIELKKTGINYTGLCPFHNEKTPSFYVSPDRGTFKCFGCGEGGDIFTFVEKIEGLNFRESLEKFALETGIVITKSRNQAAGASHSQKDQLYAATEWARSYWQKQLLASPDAIAYLKKRGFSKQQIIDYAIGYAEAGWENLKKFLLEKNIPESIIEQAGLIKTGEKGRSYDRFRERIIFPLRNVSGKTIAFSGRYIGNDDVSAKYLNSPETPIFNKSKELYGMDMAKHAMRKHNFAIVVEGQVDLVMGQSVYPNTVATSGTSLTKQHLTLIRRFADRILFVFDSDNAGVQAAFKASILALELDFEVRMAALPQGEDPADVILRNKDEYREVIRKSKDVFDYWTNYINNSSLSPRERSKMVEERIFPLLRHHTNSLEQDRYIKMVSHALDINPDSVRKQMNTTESAVHLPKQTNDVAVDVAQSIPSYETPFDRLLVIYRWQMSLSEDNRMVNVDEALLSKLSDDERKAFEDAVHTVSDEPEQREETFFAIEKIYQNSIILENDIAELVNRLSIYRHEQRQKELTSKHQQALRKGNTEEAAEILQKLQAMLSRHA